VTTMTLLAEKAQPDESVEIIPPRVWGLSPRELHDAFWSARGVQCVRQGEVTSLQRAAELYLLIQPAQLVLFDVRELIERLMWRNATVTRLRVVSERGGAYGEKVDLDDAGNVRAITRRYRAVTGGAHRVLLTGSRRIAHTWMNADSARRAWERIRRAIPWASIDHWRCAGRCLEEGDPDEEASLLTALVERWAQPDAAVEGLREVDEGVWALDGDRADAGPLIIGPAWIGSGPWDAAEPCLIGPAWRADRGTPARHHAATVKPIRRIELDTRRRHGNRPRDGAKTWANSGGKRVLDIVLSIIGLVALAPLFPIIMALVWLDDGAPVFFGHVRQSKGGKTFRCWKFRTMVRNADALAQELRSRNQADGPQFYIEADPRVTRVGRVLRTTHLDELPQLWNVLRGQMSLVGPRPSPDGENQFCPPWRDLRLSVRPGITGLWQIRRTREPGTDFQEWIKYDIEYVRTATPALDLKIIAMTIWNALRRR